MKELPPRTQCLIMTVLLLHWFCLFPLISIQRDLDFIGGFYITDFWHAAMLSYGVVCLTAGTIAQAYLAISMLLRPPADAEARTDMRTCAVVALLPLLTVPIFMFVL